MSAITCAEAEERRLDLSIMGEPVERDAALAAHLRGCAHCRSFVADIDRIEDRLGATLRAMAGSAPGPLSDEAAARVRRAVAPLRRARPLLAAAAARAELRHALDALVLSPAAPSSAVTTSSPAAAPTTTDEKLTAPVRDVDWPVVTKALVADMKRQRGEELSPEELAFLSRWQITLTDMARELGARDVDQVFDDPRVVVGAFLPAWIDALGANLDDRQRETLRDLAASLSRR